MKTLSTVLILGIGLLGAVLLAATESAASIDRFFLVEDNVATGGQPSLAQLSALKAEGYRTVISLREPAEFDAAAEQATVRELGLLYVSIPVKAADPKPAEVDAFFKALANPKAYPVFIHCGSGNRVGAFWMIRRVLVDGWKPERAEKEARQIGLKSQNLLDFANEVIAARSSRGK